LYFKRNTSLILTRLTSDLFQKSPNVNWPLNQQRTQL